MRGHLTRSRVVHGVRREFLQVVQELEGEHCVRVGWPRESMLCLPVFREEERDEGGSGEEFEKEADSTSEDRLQEPLQAVGVPAEASSNVLRAGEFAAVRSDVRASEPAEPVEPVVPDWPRAETCHQMQAAAPQLEDSAWLHDLSAFPESYHHLLESLSEPVPAQLPRDRQSLLQRRAQISMELLWLRQAIASRQNVSPIALYRLC